MPTRRSHMASARMLDPAAKPTLTIPEAARLLGVSKSCAYEAAKRGDIPTIPIAGRRLVPTAKLLELLGLSTPGRDSNKS